MRRDTARRHRKAAGGRLPASPQRDASSPSLKAHHPSSRLWQFLQLEFEIGSTFWPEVFSALSMTVPSVYAYYAAPELASISVFPEGIWALTIGTMVHCPFSVAYHLACAVLDKRDGFDSMCTPFRTMDLTFIHLAAIVFAWALSQGSLLFTVLMVAVNGCCILMLIHRLTRGRPGGLDENMRVTSCVFLYTSPLLARGDYFHYAAVMASWLGACLFFLMANRFNLGGGWSHGLFHLMLAPFLHFMMRAVANF